jgi:hypothetical protein
MSKQEFPPGWDEKRIQSLLAELDQRTEDEWVVGDEAAAAEGRPGRGDSPGRVTSSGPTTSRRS